MTDETGRKGFAVTERRKQSLVVGEEKIGLGGGRSRVDFSMDEETLCIEVVVGHVDFLSFVARTEDGDLRVDEFDGMTLDEDEGLNLKAGQLNFAIDGHKFELEWTGFSLLDRELNCVVLSHDESLWQQRALVH